MKRFPLSSEQLELLTAFENAGSLAMLAGIMGRDQSVISRQLQRLAEDAPVIIKENGKWTMTSIGRDVNALTEKTIDQYAKILEGHNDQHIDLKTTALIIINAQRALLNSKALRSNLDAEKNIERLLSNWRSKKGIVIHVKHFFKDPASAQYIEELSPKGNEAELEKKQSSSFAETNLQEILDTRGITNVVLAGFTANECIEATARDAFEKGYGCFVVGDGTAMFDFVSPDQKLYKAEKIHELVLGNIALRYGRVENTGYFLHHLDEIKKS